MASANLDEMINEAKALTPEQQRELRDVLDTWFAAPQSPPAEDEFEQELLRSGLLSELPPAMTDAADDTFEPIPNKGKPLSEVIIEERR